LVLNFSVWIPTWLLW